MHYNGFFVKLEYVFYKKLQTLTYKYFIINIFYEPLLFPLKNAIIYHNHFITALR